MSAMKELVYIMEEQKEIHGMDISEEEARAIYFSRKIAEEFVPVITKINTDLAEINKTVPKWLADPDELDFSGATEGDR